MSVCTPDWPVVCRFAAVLALVPGVIAPGQVQAWQDAPAATATEPVERKAEAEFDPQIQLESFDLVWERVRQAHWEPERVGESWDEARQTYRPRIAEAESVDDVREVLNEMLETLGQSHYGIIPANEYRSMEEEQAGGGAGTLGLEIRYLDEQLVVTRVRPGFPADEAGIQPGWVVTKIGKRESETSIEKARKYAESSVMRMETIVALGNDARTSGDPGDEVTLELIDNSGQSLTRTLTLAKSPGKLEKLGNLPSFTVDWQSRRLPDDIGYISFNAFIGGPRLAREFQQAIYEYRDARGLVIDLRGNRGGLVVLVAGMCGWLVDQRDPIGTMRMSGGNELNLVLNPRRMEIETTDEQGQTVERRERFSRPVAVLIDECSISAAEIMAGGLKDLQAAEVFGSTTAGLALPSIVIKLPNGDGFQYALADYHSASGQTLEGEGVAPNRPVELSRESLASGGDPVLDAATTWILEQADSD